MRDTSGDPVAGATVTLYRSDVPGGPFAAVPAGSATMSPGNRTNPDLTGADGLFGWDVTAGYYKVRAEKAGCTAPGGDAFVESDVLTIPPPVTDLTLVLSCPTTLDELLTEMVADGRLPNQGVANSILKQAGEGAAEGAHEPPQRPRAPRGDRAADDGPDPGDGDCLA